MRNKLNDLNNHLFAQMERLADEDLSQEEIEMEAIRAKSMIEVSDKIIDLSNTQIKAVELIVKHGAKGYDLPVSQSDQKKLD